jgi:hypothetical protein
MKLSEILTRLFAKKPQGHAPEGMSMQAADAEMTQKILDMLSITQEEELTCDDVFALLDQFTERTVRGEDANIQMPLVKQHLDICGDCREEFEALERILTSTD